MKKDNDSKKQLRKEPEEARQAAFASDHSIAESQQPEERLRASNLLYQGIFEAAKDGILILDADSGEIIDVNPYLEGLLGYSHEDLLRKKLWEVGAYEDIEVIKKAFEKLQYEGYARYENLPLRAKDGRLIDVEFVSTVYQVNRDEKVIQCIVRDITERKRAEDVLRKSEERFRALIETTSDWVWEVDKDGFYTYASPKVKDLLGYEPEEVLGKRPFDLMLPDEVDRIAKLFWDIVESHKPFAGLQNINLHKDGRRIVLETSGVPIFDAGMNLVGYRGIDRDITRRKLAEDALRKSEEKYRRIVDTANEGIWILDADYQAIFANARLAEMLGYLVEEIIGHRFDSFLFDEDLPDHKMRLDARRRGVAEHYERRFRHKDGHAVWTLISATPIFDSEHRFQGAFAMFTDITDRKQAEEALRESMRRYDLVVEASGQVVYEYIVPTGQIIWGRSIEKVLGYSMEEISGGFNQWLDLLHPDDRRATLDMLDAAQKALTYWDTQYRMRHNDGHYVWIRDRGFFLPDEQNKTNIQLGMLEDITERKLAEEALRESEGIFRVLFNQSYHLMGLMNIDGTLLKANATALEFAGITESDAIGRPFWETPWWSHSEEQKERVRNMVIESARGNLVRFETHQLDAEGRSHIIDFSIKPVKDENNNVVLLIPEGRDITELKRAEEEAKKLESRLAQAQKIEALGTLAGGIAHDFNNILAAIIGYTELAMYHPESPEKVKKYLEGIYESSKRARDLVSQILTFSRQSEKKYTPVTLRLIIEESLNMLRSVIPVNIEIRQNLMTQGLVMADPTQIHQMMMNLASNAEKAMGENGGVLEVTLEKVIVDDPTAHTLNLSPGSYLRITVKDTGHGMTPEIISRIYEPYFTTRDTGKGTGLCLSIIHGIVVRHSGAITCKSEPGKGSAFEIYLPEIEPGEQEEESRVEMDIPSGSERILFIDDEPTLGNIAEMTLKNLGYQVTTRTNSKEALDLFTLHPDQYDLVITDMTMPDMTGDKLAQKIMEVKKDIPIILCTGFSEYISKEKAESIGIREFIMKPFEMKKMARTIRKVLDEG